MKNAAILRFLREKYFYQQKDVTLPSPPPQIYVRTLKCICAFKCIHIPTYVTHACNFTDVRIPSKHFSCKVQQIIIDKNLYIDSSIWSYIAYICNRLLQPFSQDYGLASHTTHVVPNDSVSRSFFMVILFTRVTQSFWQNIFHISFWCLTWCLNRRHSSNKPTHCLLHYGNFICMPRKGKFSKNPTYEVQKEKKKTLLIENEKCAPHLISNCINQPSYHLQKIGKQLACFDL